MLQSNLINIVLKIMRTLLDRSRKCTMVLITTFFLSRTSTSEVSSHGETQIDHITHSMENLNLDIQIVRRSQRTRKPNRRYYNQDLLTEFDK